MSGNALHRVLGVAFGLAVIVGTTIGMGILRTPGEVAAHLPDPALYMATWILGGAYALLGTIIVAELATMIPRSGGFYTFARRAFGEYAGFVIGWSDWLGTCGTIAAIAVVVADYAGALVPALAAHPTAVALSATLAVALLDARGVRWAARTQELTSLVKTLAFVALIAACFFFGGGTETSASSVAPAAMPVPHGWALAGAAVLALQGVIYTYDGWYCTIYVGEEMRDPERGIPRAMFGGTALVLAIYLLLNLALLSRLSIAELAGAKLAVGRAAESIFGARAGTMIGVLATISMLAALNANTISGPRILFALARDGLFWSRASAVNAGGTPTVALLLNTITASLMIVFSGTFERVLAALAFFFVINYTIAFACVFVLRKREPGTPRPYRALGHPWTTGVALFGSIAFLAGAIASDAENSIYAVLLLALSYPAFRLLRLAKRS